MSCGCAGVQTKVREFAPKHCFAHVLNLVLVDSCQLVSAASKFFALLEALYFFMATSKGRVVFIETQNSFLMNNL